jgi:hypothetical protein
MWFARIKKVANNNISMGQVGKSHLHTNDTLPSKAREHQVCVKSQAYIAPKRDFISCRGDIT